MQAPQPTSPHDTQLGVKTQAGEIELSQSIAGFDSVCHGRLGRANFQSGSCLRAAETAAAHRKSTDCEGLADYKMGHEHFDRIRYAAYGETVVKTATKVLWSCSSE